MRWRLTFVALAAIGLSGLTAPAESQAISATRAEPRETAPMIWLVHDEPAYPMRPFPFAFDGIDNDEDGCYDVEDPDEVMALEPVEGGLDKKAIQLAVKGLLVKLLLIRGAPSNLDWEKLTRDQGLLVERLPTEKKDCRAGTGLTLPRFRLCEKVTEADGSGTKVECGPQPAVFFSTRAADAKQLGAKNLRFAEATLRATQYWMYYPWDDGHLHDGEHVSVFTDSADVQAVVGAGHLPSTANNVLAAFNGGLDMTSLSVTDHVRWDDLRYPIELPQHPMVLVEMGKHASAPDWNCNGRFDVGQDANFLPTGAWGTRDVNYGARQGHWGEYDVGFSFDRAGGTLLLEEDATANNRREEYRRACHTHSLGRDLIDEILAQPEDPSTQRGQFRTAVQMDPEKRETERTTEPQTWMKYKLLDGAEFGRVLLPDGGLRDRILANWKTFFPAFRPVDPNVVLSREFIQLMTKVAASDSSTAPRPDVWKHSDFGKYENDFKAYLFRRFSVGPSYTLANGNARWGGYFRWVAWPDRSLETHVWFDRLFPSIAGANPTADVNARLLGIPKGRPIEVAAYFNNFSTSYQGMYGGLSFRASDLTYQRAKLFPRGSTDESQGIDYVQRIRIPRNLFLEAGYSFSVPWDQAIPGKWEGLKKFLEKRPIQARLGVAGPLIWGRAQSTPIEANNEALVADQRTHGVEFRLTLHVRLGNLGSDGGHPLEKTGGKK